MSSYSELIEDIEELREEIEEFETTYQDKKKKLTAENEKLNNIDKTFREEMEQERDRQLSKELESRTSKLNQGLNTANKRLEEFKREKQHEINSINIEDFSKEFREEEDLKNNIIKDIEFIKLKSSDILGNRLSNKVYELSGKTKFDFNYESFDEISYSCRELTRSADSLDFQNPINPINIMNKVIRLFRMDVDKKAGILIAVVYLGAMFFFYEYLLPILFLYILVMALLYIYCTSKILRIIYESKAISDNIEPIIKTIDNAAQQAMEEHLFNLNKSLADGTEHYDNIIKDFESQKEAIRQELLATYKPNLEEQENRKQEMLKQIRDNIGVLSNSCKSIQLQINNCEEDIKSALGKIEDAIDETISRYYNYDTSGYEYDSAREGGKLLPQLMPYYKSRDNEGVSKLNYFEIPRCKSVFIYNREKESDMINFVRKLLLGLVMNMKPASLEFTILDTQRLCQDFRLLLDKELPYKMTYNDEQDPKHLRAEFKDKMASRFNDETLKSLGADEYNLKKIKGGSEPKNYNIILDVLTKDGISSAINGDAGNTSFDVGMYSYYFFKSDDLARSDYELLFERVGKVFFFSNGIFEEYSKNNITEFLKELEETLD